jgi:hypothetical protein
LIKAVQEFSEPGRVNQQNITDEYRGQRHKKDEKINRQDTYAEQYTICLTHHQDLLNWPAFVLLELGYFL